MSTGKPAKCPDCGTKLDPEIEACPNCPWSYKEPEAENNPLKAQSQARDLLLPAAFFGLLGFAVWKLGLGLFNIAQDNGPNEHGSFSTGGAPVSKAAAQKNLDDSIAKARAIVNGDAAGVGGSRDLQAELENRGGSAGDSGGSAPGGASSGGPGSRKGGGSVTVMPKDSDAFGDGSDGEGQGTISVVKESKDSQTARPPREWRLRGRVYDLVTLKPVPGALIILIDNETNSRAETQSSADGRYRTVLPPLHERGYTVSIRKTGYAQTYAGPESAGVKDLDAGSRKELARQLGRSVEAPASLEPGSEAPLVTDFFLAPLDVR